jgi:hypothetical protein
LQVESKKTGASQRGLRARLGGTISSLDGWHRDAAQKRAAAPRIAASRTILRLYNGFDSREYLRQSQSRVMTR